MNDESEGVWEFTLDVYEEGDGIATFSIDITEEQTNWPPRDLLRRLVAVGMYALDHDLIDD